MEQYIALLRGINVGGKNKISMPLLKAAFEKHGFSDVRTYINSGNVIFSCVQTERTALQAVCRKIIADTFSLDIALSIVLPNELAEALDNAPAWWDADADSKHNAIFVIAPATAETVLACIGETKPDYERIAHAGQVLFWSAPIQTFSRTRLTKVVTTSLSTDITIRNANTTKKLLQLVL